MLKRSVRGDKAKLLSITFTKSTGKYGAFHELVNGTQAPRCIDSRPGASGFDQPADYMACRFNRWDASTNEDICTPRRCGASERGDRCILRPNADVVCVHRVSQEASRSPHSVPCAPPVLDHAPVVLSDGVSCVGGRGPFLSSSLEGMLSVPATTDRSCTSAGIIAATMNRSCVACLPSGTRSVQVKTQSAMVHASRPGRNALAKGSHLARCDLAAANQLTVLRRHPSTASAGPSLRPYHHLGAEPSSLAQVCSAVKLLRCAPCCSTNLHHV